RKTRQIHDGPRGDSRYRAATRRATGSVSAALAGWLRASLRATRQTVNGSAQRGKLHFSIGESRLASGQTSALEKFVFPDPADLIKRERKTFVWRLALDEGESVVVKMYRHRGPLNIWRERLLGFRVQHEFKSLDILATGGVPCSVPLLWGTGSAARHGYFENLVTREIAGAVNLKEILNSRKCTVMGEDLLPLFKIARQAHQCGVYHGALWPKNILVTAAPSQPPRFHLIDMARSIRF